MGKYYAWILRFWQYEHTFAVLLCLQAVIIFIGFPLVQMGYVLSGRVVNIIFVFLLVSGVFTISKNQFIRYLSLILGIATVIYKVLLMQFDSFILNKIGILLPIISLAMLLWVVEKIVLTGHHIPAIRRLTGAVVGYLCIGLLFNSIYEYLYLFIPNSFQGAIYPMDGHNYDAGNFIYFSFVRIWRHYSHAPHCKILCYAGGALRRSLPCNRHCSVNLC